MGLKIENKSTFILSCFGLYLLIVSSKSYVSTLQNQNRNSKLKFWTRMLIEDHIVNLENQRYLYFHPSSGFGDVFNGILNSYGFAVLSKRVWKVEKHEKYRFDLILSKRANREITVLSGKKTKDTNVSDFKTYLNRYDFNYSIALLKSEIEVVHTAIQQWFRPGDCRDSFQELYGKDDDFIPSFDLEVKRVIAQTVLEPSEILKRNVERYLKKFHLCQSYKRTWTGNGYFSKIMHCGVYRDPYIGIQARIGTGIGEGKLKRFRDIQENVNKVARCFCDKLVIMMKNSTLTGHSIRKVYIATDTPSFRNILSKIIMREIPDVSVYFMNYETYHTSKNITDRQVINTHTDNILLGNARHIIALRSGFAETAFFRGNALSFSQISYKTCPGLENSEQGNSREIGNARRFNIFERDGNEEFTISI